jgi:hypothetical protein
MDWVKLNTSYSDDVALAALDDAAEVMFTRGLAYAGRAETSGFIPAAQIAYLTRTPSKAKRIATSLTQPTPTGKHGPWEVVDGGYQIRNWDHYQAELEGLAARRRADRDRQAKRRSEQSRDKSTGQSRDSHVTVTALEKEKSKNTAAAAAECAADPAPGDLPPAVAILASKLAQHTPLRGLRWDQLRAEHLTTLEELLTTHGDQPLVDHAIATCRHPAPTLAQAFIKGWEAIPHPGSSRHLAAIRDDPPCPTHGPPGTTRHCIGCHADAKAAN